MSFVFMDKAAKGGYVHIPKVPIHDVLYRQIEYFFQKTTLVHFFLHSSIFKGQIAEQYDNFI